MTDKQKLFTGNIYARDIHVLEDAEVNIGTQIGLHVYYLDLDAPENIVKAVEEATQDS